MNKDDISEEIARVRRRLADLDIGRMQLEHELERLEQKLICDNRAAERPLLVDAPVTNNSPSTRKIELFRRLFARVPRFTVLSPRNRAARSEISIPSIVKPVALANSDGIRERSVVDNWEQARVQADRIWQRFEVPSMCDAFVIGREFQVGLVERGQSFAVTAIAELHFEGAAAGHGFKSEPYYAAGRRRRVFEVSQRMARLPRRMATEMALTCRQTAELLGLRGYAKIDLRVDNHGHIFVIEANANPGLWSGIAIWLPRPIVGDGKGHQLLKGQIAIAIQLDQFWGDRPQPEVLPHHMRRHPEARCDLLRAKATLLSKPPERLELVGGIQRPGDILVH